MTISRAAGTLTFPANFMFLTASNPCPCGYFGDSERECTCSPQMVTRYQKRISGPLLDRIDIHIEVPRVDYDKLYCSLDGAGKALLRAAMQQLHMSARAYHRILKLARTIADLAGSERIETPHIAEAIQYRPRRSF